jgi:hypothetical protein
MEQGGEAAEHQHGMIACRIAMKKPRFRGAFC